MDLASPVFPYNRGLYRAVTLTDVFEISKNKLDRHAPPKGGLNPNHIMRQNLSEITRPGVTGNLGTEFGTVHTP